jgi:4-hydroxy-tetrahydrodipicolinate synthase
MNINVQGMLACGVICDLVTPFRQGCLDIDALVSLVDWQISEDIAAILVCGQAGEATSLTSAERTMVVRTAIGAAAGRVPILVGTGTNATATTIEQTAEALDLGAAAAVIVTPYYSKPSQEGIVQHFRQVADAVDIPVVVCNAPGRTASDLAPRTLERLASIPQVFGLQDCTGDITRLISTPPAISRRLRHYSGHDLTALAFNLAGGAGSISLAANIVPRLVGGLHAALRTGNADMALALAGRINPLLQILEREPGPPVIKQALAIIGSTDPEVRLPLTPVVPDVIGALRMALAEIEATTTGAIRAV